ncbi:helix-turn-helix domain-containing protein [Desulfosarcina variabilis]|uniref:helix-turn-helix domain-containing protein n=1 Tax=Desulfosarcina variabilis TaxID=2300 RepID=UPI003AFB6A72
MKTLEGRKINPKVMEEIRIRAVQRVQDGERPEQVIRTLGFSRACIYNWLVRHRNGGWHALRMETRSGHPKTLNGLQIRWVYKTSIFYLLKCFHPCRCAMARTCLQTFFYTTWIRFNAAPIFKKRLFPEMLTMIL